MPMRPQPTPEEQITRLADGSLPAPEREALLRDVADSPELTAALAEQTQAVQLIRAIDIEAPAALRARVAALHAPRPERARWRLALPSGLAVAAVIVAFVLVLAPSGKSANVRGAAQVALSAATLSAPSPTAGNPTTINTAIDGVSFPDWNARGWQATGARHDVLAGHDVDTVFYSSATYSAVGYSIAGGTPLKVGSVERTVSINGVHFEVIDADGATIVTWLRDGHTCVLASRHAGAAVLLPLASWTQQQTVS
jgi:anti-sigma factor RsiW